MAALVFPSSSDVELVIHYIARFLSEFRLLTEQPCNSRFSNPTYLIGYGSSPQVTTCILLEPEERQENFPRV